MRRNSGEFKLVVYVRDGCTTRPFSSQFSSHIFHSFFSLSLSLASLVDVFLYFSFSSSSSSMLLITVIHKCAHSTPHPFPISINMCPLSYEIQHERNDIHLLMIALSQPIFINVILSIGSWVRRHHTINTTHTLCTVCKEWASRLLSLTHGTQPIWYFPEIMYAINIGRHQHAHNREIERDRVNISSANVKTNSHLYFVLSSHRVNGRWGDAWCGDPNRNEQNQQRNKKKNNDRNVER